MKNFMKKFIALFACLLMVFSSLTFVACDCNGGEDPEEELEQFEGLSLDDLEVTYDGQYHKLVLEGAEEYEDEAEIIYYYNDEESPNNRGVKAVGVYDVTVEIYLDGFEDAVYSATLEIKRYVEPPKDDFVGLTLSDMEIEFDGEDHKLEVSGVPYGATVTYKYNNEVCEDGVYDIGVYEVKATVSKEGYNDKTLTAILKIVEPKDPDADKKVILLNDYENHKDLDTMALIGYLGKASLNSDPQYVQSGEKSCKLIVDYDNHFSGTPGVYQNTTLTVKKKDYSNFSYTSNFSIMIYNAQSEQKTLKIQLVYDILGPDYTYFKTEVAKSFTLAPNAWTKVQYDVSREYIPIVEGSSYVKGIEFFFERDKNADAVYYIDSLTIYKTSIGFNSIEKKLSYGVPAGEDSTVDEICSFDYEWQVKTLEFAGTDHHSVSMSKEYSADGIGSSLRIDTADSSLWSDWPSVNIGSSITSLINWYLYDEDDELVFDYYSPGDGWEYLGISFFYGYRFYGASYFLEHNQWHEIRIKVGDVNDYLETTTTYRFSRMKEIHIACGRALKGYPRTIFIDNVRMVRHGVNK